MKNSTILDVAHFMGLQPITGLNLINKILSIARLSIGVDAPLIRHLVHWILVREVNLYFSRIRRDDELLNFDDLPKLCEEELNRICVERGIDIKED